MSERSHRENVALGVTGPYTPTCFYAGQERISPNHRIRPTHYRFQCRMWSMWEKADASGKRELELEMFDRLAYELGGLAVDDIIFERFERTEYRAFSRFIRSAVKRGDRVSIDVGVVVGESSKKNGDCHALALKPIDDGEVFRLVANQTPRELWGYVTLRDICKVLNESADPYRVKYPYNDANITLLPAA